MKILIVGLVNNPQIKRLEQEAKKRKHLINGCFSSSLVILAKKNSFIPSLKNKPLSKYDLIYLWAISKRRWEWHLAAKYLNQKYGTKIVNQKIIDPSYNYCPTPASDYLKQINHKITFPKSAIIFNLQSLDFALKNFQFPVIVKSGAGRQGRGIIKANSKKQIIKFMEANKSSVKSFIIREFIPNNGDIRVFTVGYKAIGAMKRTPPPDDFRSNISQGGTGSEFNLNQNHKVKKIAEKLSRITKTEIAGVDIMVDLKTGKPYVLEINPGPQFSGLEKYTSTNAAEAIIKYFESLS